VRVARAEDSEHYDKSIARKLGVVVGALLCVPIPGEEGRLGSLELLNKKGGFTEADERLAVLLAGQIGRAFASRQSREEQERRTRMASIGQMLAGVLHDLRTPLTRLRLEAEMSATTDAARAAMVADINQMDAAIGQFLDYARSQPREPARCIDLSALVAACAARHRAEPAFNLDIAPGIEMRGHPTDLQRAIDNLIANALRYGVDPANPKPVTVSLRMQDETVWIEVIDQGPGIAAGAVDRLRRPFERGNVARNGDGGVGLGLAIVERIARIHGGTLQLLDADASPRRGLRARLALPYQPDAASGA
jgi:two-component system osmolarity sensor histidine kinase EnvZ